MTVERDEKILPAEPRGNGIVDGTEAADTIDPGYTGDPQGDRIDHGDAVFPGHGPDDDIVDAGGGDDMVRAGEGDDTVFGGAGNDSIDGEAGDDVLYGDGVAPSPGRASFRWDGAPDPDDGGDIDPGDDLSGGFVQDTGRVNVTFGVTHQSPGVVSDFETDPEYTDGIDTDGAPVNDQSALGSVLNGAGNSAAYDLAFSEAVENVAFRINDIDGDGVVQVRAWDSDGNPVVVDLTGASGLVLSDRDSVPGADTADSTGGYDDNDSPDRSILVEIAGPVARLEILHDQDGPANSGITVTDIWFDVPAFDTGPDGDDVLDGGDGDDELYGGGGDDTLTGGDGNDRADGGDGDDDIDTSGSQPLPDRGFPSYSGLPPIPADPFPDNDRDTVDGGDGDDTIRTGDDADLIAGGGGADRIDAGLDDDTVDGGTGDDIIVGGEGADQIQGGEGNDTIYGGLDPIFPDALNIRDDGSDGPADPDPTNGRDLIDGGAGDDVIYGQDDDDTITGGAGNDLIDGGIDEDDLQGEGGDDTLIGGHGDDTLSGGAGSDSLDGGIGDDLISGGSEEAGDGGDWMSGDTGDDRFTDIGQGDVVWGGEDDDDLDLDVLDLTDAAERANPGGSLVVDYDPTDPESGVVRFFDVGGGETGSMEFHEIENVINPNPAPPPPPCFTPGTLIATAMGERKVEDLRPGDRIITRDNGIQEIRWAGSRQLNRRDLVTAPDLAPILIRAGAIGNGLPERDMLVSPNHRILIANDKSALYFDDREVLAAAKHLTGLDGVSRVEAKAVTYIHFMFDQHEVVLSDGAWTESFQPGDMSLAGMDDDQRQEIFALFPELETVEGQAGYVSARRLLKKHEARLLMN